MTRDEIGIEQIQELYGFLTNSFTPEGWRIEPLNLSPKEAFRLIHFLQAYLSLIPDHYEQCDICHSLYDTWCEGSTINEGSYENEIAFYEAMGISRDQVQNAAGAFLCSMECEQRYWDNSNESKIDPHWRDKLGLNRERKRSKID